MFLQLFLDGVEDFSAIMVLTYLLNPPLQAFKVRPLQCESIELWFHSTWSNPRQGHDSIMKYYEEVPDWQGGHSLAVGRQAGGEQWTKHKIVLCHYNSSG